MGAQGEEAVFNWQVVLATPHPQVQVKVLMEEMDKRMGKLNRGHL
jgi:hypothetical protein